MTTIIAVLPIGCRDPESRYKVLSFFFDGVPLLEGAKAEITPGELQIMEESVTGAMTVEFKGQVGISRHQPARDCQSCHEEGDRWSRKELYTPLPQLCYECHTNYNIVPGYVHGPVVVGACLNCHDPHQSRFLKLIKSPQPELCYQCHENEDLALIASHQDELLEICTKCHDPHSSSNKKLLKPWKIKQIVVE